MACGIMGDSLVQLASNFYHENLLGEMQQLRLTGHLCDITVQVDFEGELEEFEAHQLILAASSGYFKGILLGKDPPPAKIFLGTVPPSDFGRFLEFAYTAKLEVERSKTGDILEMAKLLQCRDLAEACRRAGGPGTGAAGDPNAPQIDVLLRDGQSTDALEHDPVAGLLATDLLEDGLGAEMGGESALTEKPRPLKRGRKQGEGKSAAAATGSVGSGRRQSNRLAGRRVAVDPPKKKYLRKLKAQRKAPEPMVAPDPVEGAPGGEGVPEGEGPLGGTADGSGSSRGGGAEMGGEPPEPADFADDYQGPAEHDPSESDFQIEEDEEKEEEEEEEEEEEGGRSRGEKRKRNGQFQCEKCQRSFHYEKSYLKHISASHGEQPEVTYRCATCAQTFANRCNLKIHERHVHSDERLFPCSVCGKAFKRKKDVKRHCRQVHEGGGDRHACPVCAKSLSSKTALVLHQRTHTGDRPYHCTDCSAKFSQSSALKTHRRTHTGEKPFSCDQCDARFTQNHMLSYHKRCHTGYPGLAGERPYSCEECGKQFTQLNALQRHNRIHTGEKPYMCMLCNRTFTDKSTVRRHTMTHDKDTPWKNYLVILEGNMEGGRKVTKRGGGGAKDKESSSSSSRPAVAGGSGEGAGQEGPGPEGKQADGGAGVAQVQPVTLSGEWTSTSHGAITLVSHTSLAGFTLIQTELPAAQLQPVVGPDSTGMAATQVISLETPGVAVPLQVPVSVSAPLSIHVPGSAPFTVPISVSLPAPAPTSLSAAISDPLPVPESTPLPVPEATPLPVSVSLPVPVSASLPVPVSAPLPVADTVALSVCGPVSVSGDVCVSVSPELNAMQDQPPIVTSDPSPSCGGHLGGTEDVTLETVDMETMEVTTEDTPSS
ncbi:GDNF-inducible zinc finger protein 1 [Anguilla rostrata]|uniref:GDNF-inducible zinc finger protein 1 n=1 Tax=Anguilla rostrata TaxID=7938 RepID=UPI0030CCF722